LDLAVSTPPFLFLTCQAGRESLAKSQYQAQVPNAKFAFSRPGFVTFRLPSDARPEQCAPQGLFARTFGRSLQGVHVAADSLAREDLKPPITTPGPARRRAREFRQQISTADGLLQSATTSALLEQVVQALGEVQARPWEGLHFWPRDGLLPADTLPPTHSPDPWPGLAALGQRLTLELQAAGRLLPEVKSNRIAQPGQVILDLCLLEPNHLWLGEHVVTTTAQRWPGGCLPLLPTAQPPISRAYFKIREAASWAELPLRPPQIAVEIGAAPGGSCQWLLEQGLTVIGIDPADIQPPVLGHPNFMHIRRRGREVRRRDLRGCHWLLSDANLPPAYMLDTFQDLLQHRDVQPLGLIMTLKLPDTRLLEHWESWRQRVRDWGFSQVRGRQLTFNRQEICLVATR